MKRLGFVIAIALGCGGAEPDGPDLPEPDPDPVFGPRDGSIQVVEHEFRSEDGRAVVGRAFGRIQTEGTLEFHTETMRAGACRMLEFSPALCEPFCNGICVAPDRCEPFPGFADAGAITVAGLSESMTLATDGVLNFYNPTRFPVAQDLFAPGAEISASAAGAVVPAFTVGAFGVARLEPDFGGFNVDIGAGDDFTFTWADPMQGARVALRLRSPNEGHGLPETAVIECDAPDTGSITVPGEMIDAFPPNPGLTICVGIDCPPSSLSRYTRGVVEVDALEIEIVVASTVEFGVVHEQAQ